MADFAPMYRRLFRSQTAAIEILQKAQQDTELMYIESLEPAIPLLAPDQPDTDAE